MSNPLDSLIETLKSAEPRAEAIDRTVASVNGSRTSCPRRLVPLAAAVAAISLAVLWPRGNSGVAWAQIAAQPTPLRYVLRAEQIENGKARLVYESKVDNVTHNYRLSHKGSPGSNLVIKDGNHFLPSDSESIAGPFGEYMRFRGVATFSRKPVNYKNYRWDWSRAVDLDQFLKEKSIRQRSVERNAETRVGTADRYQLDQPSGVGTDRSLLEVFVQPGSTRILGWDSHSNTGGVYQTTIDYPDHFDPSDWAFPVKNDVPTFDLDLLDAWAREQLKHPLAVLRAGGVTSKLLFVVQGVRHEMWFVWSGAKPNGDLKEKVQVLGIKNGLSYGLAEFAVKPGVTSPMKYGGQGLLVDRRLDYVDLRVPVFTPGAERSKLAGYATVRHVPVKQVPEVYAIFGALTVRRTMR